MSKIWVILSVSVVILLILYFFVCKFFYKCRLLNDILKEAGPDKTYRYSQGRTYLFASVVLYLVVIFILFLKTFKLGFNLDKEIIDKSIDALQWSIILFASYAFGGKGLDTLKYLFELKDKKTNENQQKN